MSNCKHKVPCGCNDNALTTQAACGTGLPNCPTPDPCPETFCAGCLVYCGDDIIDLGIENGNRMDVILQMITLHITNPGCIVPRSTIGAIVAFIPLVAGGTGYTPGNYTSVPLLGGTGTGAVADCVVNGSGVITSITLTGFGTGYSQGDILYPDPNFIGIPTLASTIIVYIEPCRSVLGLHSTTITSTTIGLAWLSEPSSTAYQVEYKLATASSWTLNASVTPVASPTDTIGLLLPNTDYHIRVSNICALGACYSVTILVRTKQL